jgi:protein TonB
MAYAATVHMCDQNKDDCYVETSTNRKSLTDRQPHRRQLSSGRWSAAAVSLVLHSAVAIALVGSPLALDTGAVQTPTDAISVEIAASAVIEQATVGETDTAAALPAATALTDGAAVEALAASEVAEAVTSADMASEVTSSTTAETSKPTEAVISGSGPEAEFETMRQPDVQRSRDAKPKAQHVKERPEKTDRKRDIGAKPDKGASLETQAKGGVRARGASDAAQSNGRVSASVGTMVGYAALVRARVASNRPSIAGRGGTAVISFAVTTGGRLAYARLARSSGTPMLDQAALAAVRRSVPFPPPPAGASARQLAFSIPFHFK